jgi:ureidoglycolate hydrolase
MADETKRGTAYPRIFGAVVKLEDGTEVVARNGNNGRVHALAQVTVLKSGSRWVIVERSRGV